MAITVEPQAVTQARLEELARQQGVSPIEDPSTLIADFWPEDETVEDFLAALEAWHREGEPSQP